MSGATALKVESLRPAAMQSEPVMMDRVFDDADGIIDLIQRRAPYPTLAEFHKLGSTVGGLRVMPWFRTHFSDDVLLNNEPWIEAAKSSFSAAIVEPLRCILNINAPLPNGGAHVDLPIYRGFAAPAAPVWLLMNMTYSGLFHPWMVPVASGLAWFYRGEGGDFEYWRDGPKAPASKVRSPMWNIGLMSDNEFLWHRVGAIGSKAEQDKLTTLRTSDCLHYAGNRHWEIRDNARPVARFAADELRISLLWKARVFKDARHKASFADPTMDLTIGQVVEIYRDDLARRGISVNSPQDPFTDPTWLETLQTHYRPAIEEHVPYN